MHHIATLRQTLTMNARPVQNRDHRFICWLQPTLSSLRSNSLTSDDGQGGG